jgi:hypothetical protein
VEAGLAVGYRHVETSSLYGNMIDVAAALRSSEIERSSVWITVKLHGCETASVPQLNALTDVCTCVHARAAGLEWSTSTARSKPHSEPSECRTWT